MCAFTRANLISKSVLLISSAVLVASCGKFQTNPTAPYGDLQKQSIQPAQQKAKRDRSYLGMVFPEPDTHGASLNFYEGEARSYTIGFRLLMDNVQYTIDPVGLPEGATLTKSPDGHPEDYVLTWRPKVGATSPELMRNIVIKFRLHVLGTSTPEAAHIMNLINKEHELVLNVIASKEVPVIEKVEMPGDAAVVGASPNETVMKIAEGSSAIAFSVIVDDAVAPEDQAPQLVAAEEINGMRERPLVDHPLQHLELQRVGTSLGNGRFKFEGRYLTEGIHAPVAGQIAARFAILPIGIGGVSSRRGPDRVIEIDVVSSAPSSAPRATPAPHAPPTAAPTPARHHRETRTRTRPARTHETHHRTHPIHHTGAPAPAPTPGHAANPAAASQPAARPTTQRPPASLPALGAKSGGQS